jgi:hypothetical protein
MVIPKGGKQAEVLVGGVDEIAAKITEILKARGLV